jgi:hypothetical protein
MDIAKAVATQFITVVLAPFIVELQLLLAVLLPTKDYLFLVEPQLLLLDLLLLPQAQLVGNTTVVHIFLPVFVLQLRLETPTTLTAIAHLIATQAVAEQHASILVILEKLVIQEPTVVIFLQVELLHTHVLLVL